MLGRRDEFHDDPIGQTISNEVLFAEPSEPQRRRFHRGFCGDGEECSMSLRSRNVKS